MKQLIIFIILSLGLLTNIKAQSVDTCFSKRRIINIYNNIRVLEYKDSVYTRLLGEYEVQCTDYKAVLKMDSITIEGQKAQISNLEANVQDWKKAYEISRPKWYERPFIMFPAGAVLSAVLFSIL